MKHTICNLYCIVSNNDLQDICFYNNEKYKLSDIKPYAVEIKCSCCKEIYSHLLITDLEQSNINYIDIKRKVFKCPYCGKRNIVKHYQLQID